MSETAEEPEFAVFVDPACRGRGKAGEFLRHCPVHAAADGHRALRVHVQEGHGALLGLARPHGFTVTGEPTAPTSTPSSPSGRPR